MEEVDAPLIEVASADGLSAMFIAAGDRGELKIVTSDDPEFADMCAKLGRKPAPIIKE